MPIESPLSSAPEGDLVDFAEEHLSKHFVVHREARGKNLLTGQTVRADLLCVPGDNLVRAGFVSAPFVVEVKSTCGSEPQRKARDMAWQMVSYRFSRFDLGIPAFCLAFPRLTAFYGVDKLLPYAHWTDDYKHNRARVSEVETVLMRGNVGWLEWRTHVNDQYPHFVIGFGGDRYWSEIKGVTERQNSGLKLYVGNMS